MKLPLPTPTLHCVFHKKEELHNTKCKLLFRKSLSESSVGPFLFPSLSPLGRSVCIRSQITAFVFQCMPFLTLSWESSPTLGSPSPIPFFVLADGLKQGEVAAL